MGAVIFDEPGDFQQGAVLLIDKPLQWTSFDVVKKIRNQVRVKKVGHAGTLDPLATGLLIICTGRKTKSIDQYQGMEKEYTGSILLGKTTPSLDLETIDEAEAASIDHVNEAAVRQKAAEFEGSISQVPPAYSAVKVNGKRGYKAARQGEQQDLKPRQVQVYAFEITGIEWPYVAFRVRCSKGTYLRSLARDFGTALGTLGCLASLRRTRIGDYRVEDAMRVEEFVTWMQEQKA